MTGDATNAAAEDGIEPGADGPVFKRKHQYRGPRVETESKPSDLARILACVSFKPLVEMSKTLPAYECGGIAGGRKNHYPPILLFWALAVEQAWGSQRSTIRQLGDRDSWERIRGKFKEKLDIELPKQPVRRHHVRYFENRLVADGEHQLERFCEEMVQYAKQQGFFDIEKGSGNEPHPHNLIGGDGVVFASRFKTVPPEAGYIDPETGEIWFGRSDPDAQVMSFGEDKKKARGLPLVASSIRKPGVEDSRMWLSLLPWTTGEGGDGQIHTDACLKIAEMAPGVQGQIYDAATRGMHTRQGLERGLHTITKAFRQKSKAGEGMGEYLFMNLELNHRFVCKNGRKEEMNVHTLAAQPAIEVKVDTEVQYVKLTTQYRKRCPNKNGSFRWYVIYEVPDDPRVPRRLRGATTMIRHHHMKADDDRGLNRAEHLQMFTTHNPEYAALYGLRNDTESRHQHLKHPLGHHSRSPRVGLMKTAISLMARCLFLNSNNYPSTG